jgi:hypothetical protein
MKAILRLLLLLTKRDLKGIFSVGTNNLFFCAVFLLQGSTPRHAFLNTLLFQLLLILPLFFAMSADALGRIPAEREKLWPLAAWQRISIQTASLALNPAFWLIGTGLAVFGGAAFGLFYFFLALTIQLIVCLGSFIRKKRSALQPMLWVPRLPSRVGGLIQLEIRHILSTLDLYAALMLCLAGTAYRFLGNAPQAEAFPILALIVALALSTYAQQNFGLDGSAGLARYRLLPLACWQLLLAKDAAYLLVMGVLVLPLGFVPGMTFSLMALAIGRYPSLRMMHAQTAWRFTRGDIRFGVLQVIAGGLAALANIRVSYWFLAGVVAVYLASAFAGGRWWDRATSTPAVKGFCP